MPPGKPRDRLLDAATRLFHEHGVHIVGVNQTIETADVASMTLYRQFGGKDRLVAAALERWSAHWLNWLQSEIEQGRDDPQACFAALWDALEAWITVEGFRGSFVTNTATELRGQPGHPAHQVVRAHRAGLRRLLEDVAKVADAPDPVRVAGELLIVLDGATVVAAVDSLPAGPPGVRTMAAGVLAAASR